MNDQQPISPITSILSTVLLLAISALSWYLLDKLIESGGIFAPAVVMMIQVGIVLTVIIVLILMFNQLRAPANQKANDRKIQEVIDNALLDPGKTRTTIIRLRQIKEPDQIALAASLATLLEQLLGTLETTSKEQQMQQQANLSISQTASELQQKHEQLVKAPRQRSEFLSRMGEEITLPME